MLIGISEYSSLDEQKQSCNPLSLHEISSIPYIIAWDIFNPIAAYIINIFTRNIFCALHRCFSYAKLDTLSVLLVMILCLDTVFLVPQAMTLPTLC